MAAPSNEVKSATNDIQDKARDFLKAHHPAEAVVAGKVRRSKGAVTQVFVLWPRSALSGKAQTEQNSRLDQTEINIVGRLLDQIKRQSTDLKPFKFMGQVYQPNPEKCRSQADHMKGAVCLSGEKYNPETRKTRKAIYALMTRDGYIIIVKTKEFILTQMAVEGGKGLANNIQNAAVQYVTGR